MNSIKDNLITGAVNTISDARKIVAAIKKNIPAGEPKYLVLPRKIYRQLKSNWRAPFIEEIVKEINQERDLISLCPSCHCMTRTIKNKCGKCQGKKKSYPQVNYVRINALLAHLKTPTDLHYLCSIARDAKNRGKSYGKVIFGAIKNK